MTTEFFDRKGEPISESQYYKLCEQQKYKIIKRDIIERGFYRENCEIVTSWHGYASTISGPPLIFNTKIVGLRNPLHHTGKWQWRYATEIEAVEGHPRVINFVKKYLKKEKEEDQWLKEANYDMHYRDIDYMDWC